MDEVLQNPEFQIKLSELLDLDWFKIGIFLNVSKRSLDSIKSDFINFQKQEDKAYEMIKKWFNIDESPTFKKLKLAILKIPKQDLLMEVEDLARWFLSMPSYSPEGVKNSDISELSTALKSYYLVNYGKINEVQPLIKTPANVDLINTFVDLCIVDAVHTEIDAVFSVERKEFFKKQMSYTPIPYSEIFMQEKSVILVSGIAGIGKTWLLRKCLLDWANGLIWKNVELVFYLECRRLNQYQNVSNINEILNVFYKDILNGVSISNRSVLLMIDGLDEFKYFNELLNPNLKCNYLIVNVLEEIRKFKHLVAGRVYAIDKYQSLYTEHSDISIIQVMGFNENGINNYIENNVKEENKVKIKTTLKEFPIANAMASVPFYLSSMCKIISDSKNIYKKSFLTMTELYANIFIYFLQKHIIKSNKLIYEIMEDNFNKKYVLNICKIAYQLFVENKIIFSKNEIQTFISDFDQNEYNLFGFIEKIETNLGCYYQFTHLTIMEFCTSVYAYNCLGRGEILKNEKLRSCLPMICGLTNTKENSLLKFLVNLNPSNKWFSIFEKVFSAKIGCEGIIRLLDCLSNFRENLSLFIECFYESQSSFTDEIKSIIDYKQSWSVHMLDSIIKWWEISINDAKTCYETSCDNYFVSHFITSHRRLSSLIIDKDTFSDEEQNLLIQCSKCVCDVKFYRPIKLNGWKPKHKIEKLEIMISDYFITKNDFEGIFLPWIILCKELHLSLHNDIDFINEICEKISCLNIIKINIEFRGKSFSNFDE